MATTKTLPDGKVVTMPAYSESADIGVINTDLSNIVDNINTLHTTRAKITNSSITAPEFVGLKITNTGSTADVITFGGGDSAGTSGNQGGIMYDHSGRYYTFRSKGTSGSGSEDFKLPAHSNDNSSHSYNILTTKDFPFERITGQASGGTLRFSAKTNVRHAYVCCASVGFHLLCNNATDSNVWMSLTTDELSAKGFTLTKSAATYTLTRTNGNSFNYEILWI